MRLIDADRLKEYYETLCKKCEENKAGAVAFDKIVDLQPTLSFTPCGTKLETSAQWLPIDGRVYRCSACGDIWGLVHGYKFCPNCGAKMDGRREDGDTDG